MRVLIPRLTVPLAIASLGLTLTACGGDSSGSSSPASSNTSAQSAGGGSGGHARNVPVGPLRVSGGGSAPFKVRGGDNSIQEYGAEADRSELVQAAEAAHGYLLARAKRDWSRACAYLSRRQTAQLQQLASSSPQLKGRGCAGILAAFLAEASSSTLRESAVIDAASLRGEGRRAFLLYRGAGDAGYFLPMTKEGAAWKVAAVEPTALP
ncbi:MAG TPA: hypothetical protein VH275_11625 [Solirubrobacterales bacterium]|jgi:hypothetical protein|nr:hypothetical protein [Solirubrobacterales bacterium]